MQHVSTYSSHLQAKLRTVIALQGGCAHLGFHKAYSVFAAVSHMGSQIAQPPCKAITVLNLA